MLWLKGVSLLLSCILVVHTSASFPFVGSGSSGKVEPVRSGTAFDTETCEYNDSYGNSFPLRYMKNFYG